MTKAGFTGTRMDTTMEQDYVLWKLLKELRPEELHHGDCIGADMAAHLVTLALRIPPHIHPPIDPSKRSWSRASDEVMYQPKPYLRRNQDIVDATDYLIALPRQDYEIRRSGTWSTVRYARSLHRDIYIIQPDGSIRREQGDHNPD